MIQAMVSLTKKNIDQPRKEKDCDLAPEAGNNNIPRKRALEESGWKGKRYKKRAREKRVLWMSSEEKSLLLLLLLLGVCRVKDRSDGKKKAPTSLAHCDSLLFPPPRRFFIII